jgi:ribonucleotide monophosphatase NagD (HAD superfamily)
MSMLDLIPEVRSIGELLDAYDGILLDAYGVLVDAGGILPAAGPLLAELAWRRLPFAVVTNDASRSAATYARRFAAAGLEVGPQQIVTSGSLLPAYFRERGLVGARTCVLGTPDSYDYVRLGGGVPVPLGPGMEIDAVAVCDDSGTPFLEGVERALSAVVRALETGRRPHLILPNPDLVYPKGDGELGFTAGAMALLIEAALARRFRAQAPAFDRLGKPEPHLFHEAATRLGVPPARLLMIGDQLETDIAGARAAGIDAALLAGISRWGPASPVAPTYLLATIDPGGAPVS